MDNVSEQEQIDRMRRFMREYRYVLIGGLILGIGGYFGIQTWQTNKATHAEVASMEFLSMTESLMQEQPDIADKHAARIVGQYADTAYAPLASLAQAKIKLQQGDASAAHAHLKWAIDNSDDPAIRELAKVRLASVISSQGKYDEALAMLKDSSDFYPSMVQELRGDIYLAQKKTVEARKAYTDALAGLDNSDSARKSLLQMKLEDLGGSMAAIKKVE